jgi:hypothetical protein
VPRSGHGWASRLNAIFRSFGSVVSNRLQAARAQRRPERGWIFQAVQLDGGFVEDFSPSNQSCSSAKERQEASIRLNRFLSGSFSAVSAIWAQLAAFQTVLIGLRHFFAFSPISTSRGHWLICQRQHSLHNRAEADQHHEQLEQIC